MQIELPNRWNRMRFYGTLAYFGIVLIFIGCVFTIIKPMPIVNNSNEKEFALDDMDFQAMKSKITNSDLNYINQTNSNHSIMDDQLKKPWLNENDITIVNLSDTIEFHGKHDTQEPVTEKEGNEDRERTDGFDNTEKQDTKKMNRNFEQNETQKETETMNTTTMMAGETTDILLDIETKKIIEPKISVEQFAEQFNCMLSISLFFFEKFSFFCFL